MHNSTNIHYKILELSKNLKSNNFIQLINSDIKKILQSNITIGVEIEFYCKDKKIETLNQLFPNYNFTQERGEYQFEYHIGPYSDYQKLCEEICASRNNISEQTRKLNFSAIFSPKPYLEDYGSSMQFQLSSSSHIFQSKIEEICASFCYYAKSTFLAYAPTEEDYKRFKAEFMAPTHISYGYNNRSCLFRINGESQKRIEIRAPSSLSNPEVIIYSALLNIYKSLTEESRIKTFPKIYGNSADPQYNLETLPQTIKEAEILFDEEFFK